MKFEIDFLESNTDENLLAELQRVAAMLGKKKLSTLDIDRHARISSATIVSHFGSVRAGLSRAGLECARRTHTTDEDLLSILVKLWMRTRVEFGRSPLKADLQRFECGVSGHTYYIRFGSWNKALLRAAEFAERTGVEVPEVPPPRRREPRKWLSVRKRFLVLKRDRYRCSLCNRSGVELEVDHKVPLAQGGTDALDNLRTLCVDCNRGKWSRLD